MHRNELRDPQILPDAKHNFGVMCPGALFVETLPVPHELEKQCFGIPHPGCTVMHYVTRISHGMQKHEFDVACPDAFLWKPHQSLPSMKNTESMIRAREASESTT
jgi:hypothetical protein